jgi:lysozyme family protein
MNESIINLTIQGIIDREGGFVDHPADKGGPTKYGITIRTLAEHWDVDVATVSADEVRALKREEAAEIYRWRYVYGPGLDAITDPALFEVVLDGAVHSGPDDAIKWLQRALDITADGDIGPITRENLLNVHRDRDTLRRVRARFLASRIRHLGRLITEAPNQSKFAAGWMSRVAFFVEGL